MLTSIVAATFVVGLLGSFHCAFMCGPLLAAGCATHGGRRTTEALAYFGGRLVSHALAGAVFGQLGAHAAHAFSASLLQRLLLYGVAALALAKGLRLLFAARPSETLVPIGRRPEPGRFAGLLASLVPRRALPLGLVTGALPCGLLASAWALAAATGNSLHGALVMGVFSVATAPGLAASLLVTLPAVRRRWSPAWQGALWCALAIWMGLRPLFGHVHGGH